MALFIVFFLFLGPDLFWVSLLLFLFTQASEEMDYEIQSEISGKVSFLQLSTVLSIMEHHHCDLHNLYLR